ncbi:MAG: GDSL-type esterase/lipase family protein [Acidobacteriaceae bacterium]
MVKRVRIDLSVSTFSCIALASLATALLTGCKTTPSQAEAPAPTTVAITPAPPPQPLANTQSPSPSAQAPSAQGPMILCFGDSLTAGYGTDYGQSYPDDLQRLLDAQGYHYHVVNAGISGNTTKDGLDRIDLVLHRHPQIAVVEFGGNDGLRGLPLEQTQANLSSIIQQLQQSGAKVVLAGITLPPDYGPDYIKKFNAMYPTLAKQYHIPYIPFLLENVYGVPGDMQNDNTHATAKGNQQVAKNVEALLHPLLKK